MGSFKRRGILMDVFKINIKDVELILGRALTDNESDLVLNKFTIDDWSDYVEIFLDVHGIKGETF